MNGKEWVGNMEMEVEIREGLKAMEGQ